MMGTAPAERMLAGARKFGVATLWITDKDRKAMAKKAKA
jgi:hypothetical protein